MSLTIPSKNLLDDATSIDYMLQRLRAMRRPGCPRRTSSPRGAHHLLERDGQGKKSQLRQDKQGRFHMSREGGTLFLQTLAIPFWYKVETGHKRVAWPILGDVKRLKKTSAQVSLRCTREGGWEKVLRERKGTAEILGSGSKCPQNRSSGPLEKSHKARASKAGRSLRLNWGRGENTGLTP